MKRMKQMIAILKALHHIEGQRKAEASVKKMKLFHVV